MRYRFTVIRERMQAHQGSLLDFALGKRKRSLPHTMVELVREASDGALRLASPAERAEFANAATALLARDYGVRVPAELIVPAPGGRFAMTALCATLLRPGDGVLVTEPSYPVFAHLAERHNARVLAAPLDPEREFAPALDQFSPEELASIRLVGLNYPNNPTGAVLHPGTLADLSERLDPRAVFFNDAAYGPLTYDSHPASILDNELVRRGPEGRRVVELHSFSKVYPLGPLAIAFLTGSDSVMEELHRYCDFAWSPSSSLALRMGTLCAHDQLHLAQTRTNCERRLARLRKTVTALGLRAFPAPSGLYLLCRSPESIDGHPTPTADDAAEILLDTHGVAVVPFDLSPNKYLRFSLMYRRKDLEALAALESQVEITY